MKKRFESTRIFFENSAIGRNGFHIEFVFDKSSLRQFLLKLNGDTRIRRSKAKERDNVFVPTSYSDFIKALKATQISKTSVVERYDEACLAMQDLTERKRPWLYLKDEDTLSLAELVSFASVKYVDKSLTEEQAKKQRDEFVEQCKDIIITALAHERALEKEGK